MPSVPVLVTLTCLLLRSEMTGRCGFFTGGLVVVVVGLVVVVVVTGTALGTVTLTFSISIVSLLLAVLGLRTSATVTEKASPVFMVFGTVNVTVDVPPPASAALTVPEPLDDVESLMLKKAGLFGKTVPAGATS